jgi:hypothetical protein
MSNSAFFYVDGIPTKGKWIDLDLIDDTDEVLAELARGGFIPLDEDGEPQYGGDLLVADTEGELASAFYSSRSDTFDMGGFVEARDWCDSNGIDEDAVAAYIDQRGSWNQSDFQDAYCGEYDSEVAYAEELFDECYLHDVPESARSYIDYEKFARDLFICDYYFSNGYVFRNT